MLHSPNLAHDDCLETSQALSYSILIFLEKHYVTQSQNYSYVLTFNLGNVPL